MPPKKRPECLLHHREPVRVRFSEVDSMRIVWHGAYLRYFEDGREAFGIRFGLSYSQVYSKGYTMPVVDLTCQFKQSLAMGDSAVVEVFYLPCEAAKVKFEYHIYRESDHVVVATGTSVQVFLDSNNELVLVNPDFYVEWKKRWNLI